MPNAYLALVDVDGCYAVTGNLDPTKEENPQIHAEWILDIIRQSQGYDTIYIGFITVRQFYSNMRHNDLSNQTSNTPYTLECIAKKIRRYTSKTVVVMPHLLADVFGNLPPGTALERMKKSLTSEGLLPTDKHKVHNDREPRSPFDLNKYLILWHMVMAFVEKTSDCTEWKVTVYDDKVEILEALHQFFLKKCILLPKHVSIDLIQYYNGKLRSIGNSGAAQYTYVKSLRGTGIGLTQDFYRVAIHGLAKEAGYPNVRTITTLEGNNGNGYLSILFLIEFYILVQKQIEYLTSLKNTDNTARIELIDNVCQNLKQTLRSIAHYIKGYVYNELTQYSKKDLIETTTIYVDSSFKAISRLMQDLSFSEPTNPGHQEFIALLLSIQEEYSRDLTAFHQSRSLSGYTMFSPPAAVPTVIPSGRQNPTSNLHRAPSYDIP